MAEPYPRIDDLPDMLAHPTEASINKYFNRMIDCLNRRRLEMIEEFRQREEDKLAAAQTRIKALQELTESKLHLKNEMKQNLLHSVRERLTEDINADIRALQMVQEDTELVFECDTTQLEQSISVLGQLVEKDLYPTPDYPALLQPNISVGKIRFRVQALSRAAGELELLDGVAVDESSQLIYVANGGFKSNISVFSCTGEFIDEFCQRIFSLPSGIALSGDGYVFVSDEWLHCVFKFQLPNFQMVFKVGKHGSGVGEFNCPLYITATRHGQLLIPDCFNDRIAVMTTYCVHEHYLTHQALTRPTEANVKNYKIYVACRKNSILEFSLAGEMIRTLIATGTELKGINAFCIDNKQNILIADIEAENIKVYSHEGTLLHVLGNTAGEDKAKAIRPVGIAVSQNKIICTSRGTIFGLHIFKQ